MPTFDYSIFEKPEPNSGSNPKHDIENKICFKIVLLNRKLKITTTKDASLEDLYVQVYNAVYPEYSMEKDVDSIPPPHAISIPHIYNLSLLDKQERITYVPLHKLITISMLMKTKPECFNNIAMFGTPTFLMFVLDEDSLTKIHERLQQKTQPAKSRLFRCFNRLSV